MVAQHAVFRRVIGNGAGNIIEGQGARATDIFAPRLARRIAADQGTQLDRATLRPAGRAALVARVALARWTWVVRIGAVRSAAVRRPRLIGIGTASGRSLPRFQRLQALPELLAMIFE
jgi:uncharacterized protein YjeT (DUF2065 family)